MLRSVEVAGWRRLTPYPAYRSSRRPDKRSAIRPFQPGLKRKCKWTNHYNTNRHHTA
ncbi:hypothetical protein KCP71_14930 [Salmonella enterica subsp. enterica]|nr:hypothetical protein KCP71_14930 [Salmonella enterica subsp. enterica]